jgi:hypothetical protein
MYKKNSPLGWALGGALVSALFGVSGIAAADRFGIQIAGGSAAHIRKLDLSFVWDPDLTWWQIGDWHFSLVGEGHVSWWHSDDGGEHDNIGETGITPVIRFIKGSGTVRPFVEAGAGVRLLTSTAISESHRLSTAFQFADMVGVGAQFGSRQQYLAGFRFQHVSNGGIKEPNPGINFSQLYLQYNF